MLAQLLFLALAIAAWTFFKHTTPQQRGRWVFTFISWCVLAGAAGLAYELASTGRIPIAW